MEAVTSVKGNQGFWPVDINLAVRVKEFTGILRSNLKPSLCKSHVHLPPFVAKHLPEARRTCLKVARVGSQSP